MEHCLARYLAIGRLAFRNRLDVVQHPQVNFMQNSVGKKLPVHVGMNVQTVPGAALQARAVCPNGHQTKLACGRAEVAVKVWGMNFFVRAQLFHGFGLKRNSKRQTLRRVPLRDGFGKRASGKVAVTGGGGAGAGNPCANRIGNAKFEIPFCWRGAARESSPR